jgi:galactokinase
VRENLLQSLIDTTGPGARLWRAPGRVNLIGDHTDYQQGLCLPMAIDREVVVAYRAREDARIVLRSLDFDGTVDIDAAGTDDPRGIRPAWGRVVGGVARVLAASGRPAVGIEGTDASTVPIGSGLSSSAAFEVAVAGALADAAGFPLAGQRLALAAQEAEHIGTGMPCGLMDQLASVSGRAGNALLLDCRSLAVEAIPVPADLAVVVVHSGLPRSLESSAYAQRRAACEAAAARLGLESLRDATPEQVSDDPFARHVVRENARVSEFAVALRADDVESLGRLAIESHRSLADDFGVSTPELDLLVSLATEAGAYGARLTGAGFGGCIVALVPAADATEMISRTVDQYGARTGLEAVAFVAHAVDGAGPAT